MVWFTQIPPRECFYCDLCQKTEKVLDTSYCLKLQTLMRVSINLFIVSYPLGIQLQHSVLDHEHSVLLKHQSHKANATHG